MQRSRKIHPIIERKRICKNQDRTDTIIIRSRDIKPTLRTLFRVYNVKSKVERGQPVGPMEMKPALSYRKTALHKVIGNYTVQKK